MCPNVCRPLEDDSSAVVSQSKRIVPDSSGRMVASQESAEDLFVGESATQLDIFNKPQEPRSRKRKEMDEEIDVDELESLMSEEFFDEVPAEEGQPAQAAAFSLPEKKQETPFVGESSASKKQRVHLEEPRIVATPRGRSEKDSTQPTNSCGKHVSIKTQPVCSPESVAVQLRPSKPLRVENANSSSNILLFKDKTDSSPFEVKHHILFVLNSF